MIHHKGSASVPLDGALISFLGCQQYLCYYLLQFGHSLQCKVAAGIYVRVDSFFASTH